MAEPLQLSLNNAMSPTMEELLFFHDYAMATLLLIGTAVLTTLVTITMTNLSNTRMTDANQLEFVWSLLPVSATMIIATPSMRTLYLLEDQESPHLTIKTLGHQWYWTYEYSDLPDKTFDSYMIKESNLTKGSPRLLEVDNRMIIPSKTLIRLLVSAEDVLHSWALPSIGIKTDAVPGRLNQLTFTVPRHGVFYGQCSEICGINHSFMPIVTESAPTKHFESWVRTP
uniref:Cytochrome c oxidase subunit 2 n=1 Tax=Acanthosaura armata TaxID=285987 RepID=D6RR84_9SAUR|nr:cytochrome C oxidase subunit 2 [Acanthosaura armata]